MREKLEAQNYCGTFCCVDERLCVPFVRTSRFEFHPGRSIDHKVGGRRKGDSEDRTTEAVLDRYYREVGTRPWVNDAC